MFFMKKEIERKFLVKGDFHSFATRSYRIVQAYLSSVPECSVRIRIMADKAFITVKGASSKDGLSRLEWEKEIEPDEAESLLCICEPGIIEKTRFIVPEKNGLFFEIDQFARENEGLIIAEIELPGENYSIDCPAWLGKEVTGDERFYNLYLSAKPYSQWKDKVI